MSIETWTQGGERFAVIDYDELGNALVHPEVLHRLLSSDGWRQENIPERQNAPVTSGRERLRDVAARLAQTPGGDA